MRKAVPFRRYECAPHGHQRLFDCGLRRPGRPPYSQSVELHGGRVATFDAVDHVRRVRARDVVLYWAQAVLVLIALAILLTFVFTPPVSWLSVGSAASLPFSWRSHWSFTVLGLAGWGLARQMDHLAEDLPRYRVNILAKIADVRGAGKGGSVEKLQETIEDIRTDLGKSDAPRGTASRPVVITAEHVAGHSSFAWLGPVVGLWERPASCWRW